MAKRRYYRSGTVRWINDKEHRHRVDGPASVWPNGTQYWFRYGDFHFAYGPSILNDDGTLGWYKGYRYLRGRDPYG